ncbi:hypothetical protein RND71_040450 [Anisodus tanguticus]|uniref:Uncharacterized protein n=1 Tax=Anisodus tanguticus TaxID=243964 RepID=A0AAE1QU33_9SOLA|nr:hypothetical protein RND71_040450 [Anisodus tanguticus]
MYEFEALTFNIDSGYLEAIVRGHISGLLTAADYNNLCQCETLDDIKMHLSATEYDPFLQNDLQNHKIKSSQMHNNNRFYNLSGATIDDYSYCD